MAKYQRLSAQERWNIIEPIIKGNKSIPSVSKSSHINKTTVSEWVRKFNESGMDGLENGKGWKQYSEELKLEAVEDVLIRKKSLSSVVKKYEISHNSVLKRWIKVYNSGKGLEAASSGRAGTIMTEGRKTTLLERIEITEFALARNKDYQAAMETYNVSYQQIYSWVKKYGKEGRDGLVDNRGKKAAKDEPELTELEKANLRIKELEARNEYLEMKDAFGKKLKELEERCGRFR